MFICDSTLSQKGFERELIVELNKQLAPLDLVTYGLKLVRAGMKKQLWHTDFADAQLARRCIVINQPTSSSALLTASLLSCLFSRSGSVIIPLSQERLVSIVSGTNFEVLPLHLCPGDALFIKGDTVHAGKFSNPF